MQPDGKLITIKTVSLRLGKNDIPLDLEYLLNGIYFVKVEESGEVFKLVVNK